MIWIIGRISGRYPCWQFQGAVESECEAILACIDESYFIGPAKIGVVLPQETAEWVGSYYPMSVYLDGDK